jgi:hypothetical protein
MAKFTCVCGHVISTSGSIPNPDEWRCISDEDFDAFSGEIKAEDLYIQMKVMYRCPVSDHLWFFWNGFENEPSLYSPTNPSEP